MTKKTVLITGGTRGLGRHLVSSFWGKGYSVAILANNKIRLNSTLRSLKNRKNQKKISLQCDLNNAKMISSMTHIIKDEFSHLDVLINNAAIQGPIGHFSDNKDVDWDKVINVNLKAPIYLCRNLLPLLKKSSSPSIINISGGGASTSRENFSPYAVSKTALVRFSETIADELFDHNIKVNCIAPGMMPTDMLKEILNENNEPGMNEVDKANKVLMDQNYSFEKVSNLALFLASEESRGITGKLISAIWDNWLDWPKHLSELNNSDLYTLRRITSKDKGLDWGDY
ncbi:MAG: dehydrogenase [Rickettsiales bacterium]|nr:dehydrogenase [Rickettsiales bacterium]